MPDSGDLQSIREEELRRQIFLLDLERTKNGEPTK
jgi:hypothetical protein